MILRTIFVAFKDQKNTVWAYADAEHVRDDVYRIIDCREDGSATQFREGAVVKCRIQRLHAGDALVAYEAVN